MSDVTVGGQGCRAKEELRVTSPKASSLRQGELRAAAQAALGSTAERAMSLGPAGGDLGHQDSSISVLCSPTAAPTLAGQAAEPDSHFS